MLQGDIRGRHEFGLTILLGSGVLQQGYPLKVEPSHPSRSATDVSMLSRAPSVCSRRIQFKRTTTTRLVQQGGRNRPRKDCTKAEANVTAPSPRLSNGDSG